MASSLMHSKTSLLYAFSSHDIGLRLDRYLRKQFPTLPYSLLQKAFRKKLIKVNNKSASSSHVLQDGDNLILPNFFNQESFTKKEKKGLSLSPAQKEDFEKRILYEDKDILVWNKPQNFAVHGGTRTHFHLEAYIDALMKEGRWDPESRPRLVHRLDRDTSGILILAKSRSMSTFLMKAFSSRQIKKLYWALVEGIPKNVSGHISVPLSKKELKGSERIIEDPEQGREAETYYSVLDQAAQEVSWVGLLPLTGRTHQLRVHMAHLGTPILGDRKYGARLKIPSIASSLLHLHAREIWIPTPKGKILKFTAPLSSALKESFETLGFEEKDGKNLHSLMSTFSLD